MRRLITEAVRFYNRIVKGEVKMQQAHSTTLIPVYGFDQDDAPF